MTPERLSEEFRNTWIDSGKLRGATVVICRKDDVVYREQFGDHRIDSVYALFSLTKIFTSIAVLQLQDAGKLHIDDPVSKHLPSFRKPRQVDAQEVCSEEVITIKQLLNHTAGLTYFLGLVHPSSCWTPLESREWLRFLQQAGARKMVDDHLAVTPLLFTPGSHFNYGTGHVVAACIVEELTGKPFAQYIHEHITSPLGMTDTTYLVDKLQKTRMPGMKIATIDLDHPVPSFIRRLLRLFLSKVSMDDNVIAENNITGDSGLKGTGDDLVKLSRMLLGGGELDGVRILSEASVKAMCSNSLPHAAQLVAPFSFQAAPPLEAVTAHKSKALSRVQVVAKQMSPSSAGSFGISRAPAEPWQFRPVNSYLGQGFGLGVAVVEDASLAGLHPKATGTCWWQGIASTFLAVNRSTDIGVLVLSQEVPCVTYQQAFADVINSAHEMFAQ